MSPGNPTPTMRLAILQFPASNCDQDCVHAVRAMGARARMVWHKETSLGDVDAVIVPGGFSYGDALRCGAIARFSPVMQAVIRFAEAGGLVLGICNGFQILCEAGLLPGALIRDAPTLERLEAGRQILWQYCDATGAVTEAANPNGSVRNIAGIANERFNVAGLMPHPDRAVEGLLGSEDGRAILSGMIASLESRQKAAA